MTPKYITGDALAALIKSDKVPHRDYIVVDVRDNDYAGGNIKNSLNLPSNSFPKDVGDLVRNTKDVPIVIFHCALSQVRGPKAASTYETTRRYYENSTQLEVTSHEVLVLSGGFSQFQAKFRDDLELIENWDREYWPDWN